MLFSHHRYCHSVMVLAKDRVIFLQKPWAGRAWSKRGGWSSQGGMLLAASWARLGSVTFSMSIALFLNTLVTNINDVIVHFLISLVLPVNCSYLNPVIFPFCTSSYPWEVGKEKGKGKQAVWFGISQSQFFLSLIHLTNWLRSSFHHHTTPVRTQKGNPLKNGGFGNL